LKLQSLKIRNFRSFGDKATQIEFGDGVNLLVGENNVGKSTILKSFDLLKGDFKPTPNDFHKGESRRELLVEAKFRLNKREARSFIMPFVQSFQGEKEKVNRFLRFFLKHRVSLTYSSRRGIYLRFGELHISGELGQIGFRFRKTGTRINVDWITDILPKYFATRNKLSLFEVIKRTLRARNAGGIHFRFEPNQVLIELLKKKAKSFSEIRQSPKGTSDHILESYDGRQVADVLFTLKNGGRLQRAKFEEVKRKFHDLFSNLKLEIVKEGKGSPPTIVIEKTSIEYEVPIGLVGAGIGEIIIFLTHLIASNDMIFGLDMPELHFHPHAQRLLRNIIRGQPEQNQFFVITHSPIFIESRQIENLIVVREVGGGTKVKQIRPN